MSSKTQRLQRVFVAGAVLLLLFSSAQAAQILLVDSKDASYLRPHSAQQTPSLNQQGISALISGLSGLLPPKTVSTELSQMIDSILTPSPLLKPRACVVLSVAGLTADEVGSAFSGRQQRLIDVHQSVGSDAASTVINAVTAVAEANPDGSLLPLEQLALLQDCGTDCLRQHLDKLVQAVDAELVALDILRPGAERLFALELANALEGAQAFLRNAAAGTAEEDVEVVEVTLLALHQLAASYGAGSPQVSVAKASVLSVLRTLAADFDAVYSGDVVYQVALVDSVPDTRATMQELLGWKEHSRKHLLQSRSLQATAFPGGNEVAQAKLFSTKAAGYGAFILLVYFALAAVHCMCNMPFKADSMLFGRTKAD